MRDQLRLKVFGQHRPDGRLPAVDGHGLADELGSLWNCSRNTRCARTSACGSVDAGSAPNSGCAPVTSQNPSDA